jgi:hypothetical protein
MELPVMEMPPAVILPITLTLPLNVWLEMTTALVVPLMMAGPVTASVMLFPPTRTRLRNLSLAVAAIWAAAVIQWSTDHERRQPRVGAVAAF